LLSRPRVVNIGQRTRTQYYVGVYDDHSDVCRNNDGDNKLWLLFVDIFA